MTQLDDMLVEAAKEGRTAQVELLLALGANPNANASWALGWASCYGHTDCVRLLIPVSDLKAYASQALRLAAQYGRTDCVRLLIPVSDPKANESWALYWAARAGRTDCVRLLIPVSDHYEQALAATSDPACKKLLEEAINDTAR